MVVAAQRSVGARGGPVLAGPGIHEFGGDVGAWAPQAVEGLGGGR